MRDILVSILSEEISCVGYYLLTAGDRFLGEPDAQLNPKKKVLEQAKPDMRTDDKFLATYKGSPWKLKGDPKAVIRAPSVANGQIQ